MTANLITELVIQPEKLDEAIQYLRDMRDSVIANEPHIVFYQMYQLETRPNEVWVVEVFEHEEGKQAHLDSNEYRRPMFESFLAKKEVLNVAVVI